MYKKIILSTFLILFWICNIQSQDKKFENFGDVTSIIKPDPAKWQQQKTDFGFSQIDINNRVTYNIYPILNAAKTIAMEGWRGEEVNAQLVVSAKKNVSSLKVSISNLKADNGSSIIEGDQCKIGYVYYVKADNSVGVCHKEEGVKYSDIIVPDIIDFRDASSFINAYTNRPIWLKIKIPNDAQPGNYQGKINASIDGNISSLNVTLKVSNNKLPSQANKKFFLELWQYPIAEADFYKVKPWSEEHFRLMKPAMNNLRSAGEDVITASFFWDMFNPAARDADEMFIKVTKTKAGQWTYDYTNFDKWITYMMDIGITRQITVFGMATLNYRMYYFDEAINKVNNFQQKPGGTQYNEFWSAYLKSFEKHLKEKGWFDKTTIGFSEKEPDVSVPLIKLIKGLNPAWKISFSGKYYPELQNSFYDYSLISNQQIPAETIVDRRKKGFITTYYTSCWEKFPNTFVMSNPIDATWLSWNAANRNMDGYLRYAYDYWTTPGVLYDVRSNLASGDRFLIYPDGNTSIRFEMMKDGIEDYEKIMSKLGGDQKAQSIKSALSEFDFKKASPSISRMKQVQQARSVLE